MTIYDVTTRFPMFSSSKTKAKGNKSFNCLLYFQRRKSKRVDFCIIIRTIVCVCISSACIIGSLVVWWIGLFVSNPTRYDGFFCASFPGELG